MGKLTISTKMISFFLSVSVILSSCSSTTMIQSIPSGAKIYVDGQPMGRTPYAHTDTKIVGTITTVDLEKEGYAPLYTSFARTEQVDVGAIIGGLFVWIPFLWIMKYNPIHNYELIPISGYEQPILETQPQPTETRSKADRLRELKELLDEMVITKQEYEKEKTKILQEDEN